MNGCPYSVVRVKFQILYARNCMKSKHIWGPVVSEFAWNLYGNAATLGQNCQFSRLQQTNLLAYMFCLGIKNHHFSATSWCMSNRVSFQNQATDTCCQESRHESLILIGSQNLYFDAFGSLCDPGVRGQVSGAWKGYLARSTPQQREGLYRKRFFGQTHVDPNGEPGVFGARGKQGPRILSSA